MRWAGTLMPLAEAISVLLNLLRDSGVPHKVVAQGGQYQQSLPTGKLYQLLRVRLESGDELVPEISGHRLMVMVRLMLQDEEGRLRNSTADTSFELTLCA
jgi:cell division protein ZapD